MDIKKIIQFSIGPIGAATFGFITLPIIAWFYSAEDIGRFTMIQVAVSFSVLLFSLGLDQAYVREYHEVANKSSLLKTALLPGLVILLIVSGLMLFVPFSISDLLFGVDSAYLTLVLFTCIIFAYFSRFLSLILRMQERGLAYSMSQVIPKLLFLGLIGIYVIFSFDATFQSLINAHALALFTMMIIYLWNTRGDWLPAISSVIDRVKFKQMIYFGLPLIVGGLSFWALVSMDRFFLRSMSSFDELGIYSVAVNFAGPALVFQSLFSTVWAPTIYKWAAKGVEPEKIERVIEYVAFTIVIIWSLAGMFSWIVIYILPVEYAKVQYILVACMGYPLLYTLSEATGVGIGIKRKSIYSMAAAIIALMVNALLNYYLIPIYGAEGAALSSVIAFFVFYMIKTEVSVMFMKDIFNSRAKVYQYILAMIGINMYSILNEYYDSLITGILWFSILAIYSLNNHKLILYTYILLKGK